MKKAADYKVTSTAIACLVREACTLPASFLNSRPAHMYAGISTAMPSISKKAEPDRAHRPATNESVQSFRCIMIEQPGLASQLGEWVASQALTASSIDDRAALLKVQCCMH